MRAIKTGRLTKGVWNRNLTHCLAGRCPRWVLTADDWQAAEFYMLTGCAPHTAADRLARWYLSRPKHIEPRHLRPGDRISTCYGVSTISGVTVHVGYTVELAFSEPERPNVSVLKGYTVERIVNS